MMKRDEAIAKIAVLEEQMQANLKRSDDLRRALTEALRPEHGRDTSVYDWTRIFVEIGKLLERSDRQKLVQENEKLQGQIMEMSDKLRTRKR